MGKSDSLYRTAGLDLRDWDGKNLVDYLFTTGQAVSYVDGILTVTNQTCSRGHVLSEVGVIETIDSRYNTAQRKCRACKLEADRNRSQRKEAV